VHCATPEESGSAEHPLIALPFEVNPTVPVGPDPPVSVAVKVTLCPKMMELLLDVTVVVVCVPPATGVHDADVELLALLSVNTIDGHTSLVSAAGVLTRVRLFDSAVYPPVSQLGEVAAPLSTSVLTRIVDPELNWAWLPLP